nr:restriction endonuclease subunit S [Nitrosomonas nitrosa]
MQHLEKPGWSYKKLNDLGFVGRGKSRHRPRNEPSLYGGIYPFVQTGDVKSADLYITNYFQTYNEKGLAQSKLWQPGTLLITIAANIAETAILGIEACFPDSIVGFIADSHKSDVRFVKYYIEFIKLQMQNVSRGTTQDNLSVDKLLTFDFFVPEVGEQRRIAAILSAYDDLIENNTRRIKALEQAAHDLYREWFVEFRFPGHESVPMVDSGTEYGMIPQGWGVGCLGDIAEDKRNSIHPSELESDIPYVGLEHIPRKTIALSDWGQAGDVNSTKLIFEAGDILFAKIRPYLHKVAVAPINGVSSTDAIIIVPKSPEFYALVLMCVSGEHFVEYATTTSQGTQMPRANWKVLAEYPVVIPSSELLQEFNEFVIDIVNDIRTNIFRNNALREARDLLLPRLVSGQVDVSDVEVRDS